MEMAPLFPISLYQITSNTKLPKLIKTSQREDINKRNLKKIVDFNSYPKLEPILNKTQHPLALWM